MDSGLYRIELTGLMQLATQGGDFSGEPEEAAARASWRRFVWLPAVLIVGLGAWTLMSGYSSKTAESEPVTLATAAAPDPALSLEVNSGQGGALPNSAPAPGAAAAPAQTAPIEGLTISSQSWRRGGLGSKALVTFTLRNGNDYAVKDIEISCAFARRDGSHLTDRKRMIHDTLNMRSRRKFARMHVGFVNVNADKATCSLVTASRE